MSAAPYREPPHPADPYAAGWAKYRRRRMQLWGVFFSWPFVAGGVLAFVCKVTGATEKEVGAYVALTIGLLAFVLLQVIGYSLTCPRCSKTFHLKGARGDPFTSRCMNCGVEIGTPKGPS